MKECPPAGGNQIVLNDADEGKGEQLRAGKPRKEEDEEEDRHNVGREEFRGMNGLEKKYNLVIVGAGLSGSVVAERASKLLGLKVGLKKVYHQIFYKICSESGDRQETSHWRQLL